MSVTAQIRARMQTTLQAITPSIGVVHAYERWAAEWTDFLALMKDPTGKIRAWTIMRRSSPGKRQAPAESDRSPVYVVRGFRGLADAEASELAFDSDVEAVQDALGTDITLGGLADLVDEPSLDVCEPRKFGAVLCHYAEISVPVQLTKVYIF